MPPTPALPHIDDHSVTIGAGRDAVWAELLDAVDGAFSGGSRYARLVGGDPPSASGPRPLAAGSTIPGFRITAAEPGRELRLEGRHRFSDYALTFRLTGNDDDTTELSAETCATFPGPAGSLYRLLVIRTRAHMVLVRRLLGGIARRTEGHSDAVGGT